MPIWSGRFHFKVNEECDIDYLRGAMGGFVYATVRANNETGFVTKVMRSLAARGLTGDSEFDELRDISEEYANGELSAEWMDMCRRTIATDEAVFATFRLYDNGK